MGKTRRQRKENSTIAGELDIQLDKMGMKVRLMTGDGNCLFRTMADQLRLLNVDNQIDHFSCRKLVVDYIKNNIDDFSSFLSDDEQMDSYLKRMSKDGVYGGHLELVAFTRLFQVNAMIFQDDGHIYRISSKDSEKYTRFAYRAFEHYDSIEVDFSLSSNSSVLNHANAIEIEPWMVDVVSKSTGCTDNEAKSALILSNNKIDSAIEMLRKKESPSVQNENTFKKECSRKDIHTAKILTDKVSDGKKYVSTRDRKRFAKKLRKERRNLRYDRGHGEENGNKDEENNVDNHLSSMMNKVLEL